MPGYLEWFGLKQIFQLCSTVMEFVYNNIVSNVGFSIILYALFVQFLFLPFSIKSGWDKVKALRVKKKRTELRQAFMQLSEEERADENVKSEFVAKDEDIKKGKSSTKVGCLVSILRVFVLLATTPVVSHFGHFIQPAVEAYNFLGFDLSVDGPGYSFVPEIIFPILTTLVLILPSAMSIMKNLKEREKVQSTKTKEELEEEAKMLQEMGIKDNKFPWGIIIPVILGLVSFNTFTHAKLTVTLFWGVYYIIGSVFRRSINYVFAKTDKQLCEG